MIINGNEWRQSIHTYGGKACYSFRNFEIFYEHGAWRLKAMGYRVQFSGDCPQACVDSWNGFLGSVGPL